MNIAYWVVEKKIHCNLDTVDGDLRQKTFVHSSCCTLLAPTLDVGGTGATGVEVYSVCTQGYRCFLFALPQDSVGVGVGSRLVKQPALMDIGTCFAGPSLVDFDRADALLCT